MHGAGATRCLGAAGEKVRTQGTGEAVRFAARLACSGTLPIGVVGETILIGDSGAKLLMGESGGKGS